MTYINPFDYINISYNLNSNFNRSPIFSGEQGHQMVYPFATMY